MQLNFLMVQLTHLNLNLAKRLSYISLYGLIFLTTKFAKSLAKIRIAALRFTKIFFNLTTNKKTVDLNC
jgi:hypothetical protein